MLSYRIEVCDRFSCIECEPIIRLVPDELEEHSDSSLFLNGVCSHFASLMGANTFFYDSIFLKYFELEFALTTDADERDAQSLDSLSEIYFFSSIWRDVLYFKIAVYYNNIWL